jgi:crossover junction endodeoxyribonuclease RuvC
MIVLGVDPGLTGAIARYEPATGDLRIEDVPTFSLPKAGKNRSEVDLMSLARIVDDMVGAEVVSTVVFIEQVNAMPSIPGKNGERRSMGAQSAFNFGKTAGVLLGVCAAHFLRIEQVAPRTWKTALKVPAAKDGARARASQMLPRHTHLWTRVKDDGRAEAALIAVYGAMDLARIAA